MKKILVIYDSEGWSFHHIALQIQRYLSGRYEVQIATAQTFDRDYSQECSAVICLWYGAVRTFLQGTPHYVPWQRRVIPPTCKILACLYDEVLRWGLWQDPKDYEAQWDCELLERQAIAISDRVLLANRGLQRRLWPDLPPARSIGLCEDGVDLSLFPYRPLRPDFWDQNTPLRVGWTGNTNPQYFGSIKGLDLIEQAVKDLPGVILVKHDRHTMGLIPHEQMSDFYAGIDVYVCMSACEGTPNPILEASASGRAWISTDVGIVTDLNASADRLNASLPAGMVIPREASILRVLLSRLTKDREKVARMGAVGWRAIQADWSWACKAEAFATALQELGV
jgi:hypothetical protein